MANCECKDVSIEEGIFGEIPLEGNGFNKSTNYDIGNEDENNVQTTIIKSYKMTNSSRMEVVVIAWGATIVSIKCPDKYGRPEDILLGFDNLENYMDPHMNKYIGCVLGRCANRIRDGRFFIDGKDYQLSLNDGNHHLHGGTRSLGRQVWDSFIDGCSVVMTHVSPDGEEGYPGSVLSTIKFKLTPQNKLEINIRATTSKSTVLNLSQGLIFNLAGHNAGEEELKKHNLTLNCDRWIFADINDPIPRGGIRGVGGTIMDLRISKILKEFMDRVPPGDGYNHNFCVLKNWQPGLTFVARVHHPESGRVLEVYSDQPGIHFHTCEHFPTPQDEETAAYETLDSKPFDDLESYASYNGEGDENFYSNYVPKDYIQPGSSTTISEKNNLQFIVGKNNSRYTKFSGFGIYPQNYPNAVNIKHFPCSVLRPGQVYYHDLTYKFGVQLGNNM